MQERLSAFRNSFINFDHLSNQLSFMKLLLLFSITVFILASCAEKEPAIAALQKNHSIEVSMETKRMGDTAVVLFTKQNVYIKGVLVKTILKTDTLPSPGDTIQTVESGDTVKNVRVPKEFEFFVTVK
jgi:hypothetical protein